MLEWQVISFATFVSHWNTIRDSRAIYVTVEIYGVQSARPDCPTSSEQDWVPYSTSHSTLQAELWGLCSLELARSAAPRRRVNDGRPDDSYDFFIITVIIYDF